jgi:hypothetical protein
MSDRKKLFGDYKGKSVSRDRDEENALMLEQQNDFRMQELDAKVSALKNVSSASLTLRHKLPLASD